MSPRQRQFTLVPESLTRVQNRPIRQTSKAVKAAYLKANRTPKVSRAEQRLRDAAERERIRKENDKERAAVKARAAREKKAAKSEAEKMARKKRGLPEPSRFVRASQPSISRFVRTGSNGTKRIWKDMEDTTEDSDREMSGVEGRDEGQPPAKRVAVDQDSDEEYGDFSSLSQSDILLEKVNSSLPPVYDSPLPESPAPQKPAGLSSQETSQELPAQKPGHEDNMPEDSQMLAELANTQLLSEAASAASRSDGLQARSPATPDQAQSNNVPVPHFTNRRSARHAFASQGDKKEAKAAGTEGGPLIRSLNGRIDRHVKTCAHHQDREGLSKQRHASTPQPLNQPSAKHTVNSQLGSQIPRGSRSALQERSPNIQRRAPSPKEKRTVSFAAPPPNARIPPRSIGQVTSKLEPSMPPSATQLFLETHLDAFFPSPTQQVRELLADIEDDDLPSNTQIARDIGSIPDKQAENKASHIEEFIFDTQDLILSSQDLAELSTPTRVLPPSRSQTILSRTSKTAGCLNSGPKPRFFEEKEEDLLQAALHESKLLVAPASFLPLSTGTTSLGGNKSASTGHGLGSDDGSRRFFKEKEEDLMAAAIHESKVLAQKEKQKKRTTAVSNTQNRTKTSFTEKMDSLIGESSREKRMLKRAPSSSTDYGDEDFTACEQELLALC